jgi:hypothetical protein
MRVVILISLVIVAGACDDNPHYCKRDKTYDDQHINADCNEPLLCSVRSCESPAVCDPETDRCVTCTREQDDACTGVTPVCENNICRECRAHDDCADSNLCLPDGACADVGQVAYVEPAPVGTDNTECTLAMPCTVVVKAVATGRSYVKLTGTIYEQVMLNNQNVTFVAGSGAKLTSANNGNVLRIDGTSQVAIYGLEISGASGAGFGISIPQGAMTTLKLEGVAVSGNVGGGISAHGGMLTVTRSTILRNQGGGIIILGAQFDITNNLIAKNGGPASLTGGVDIQQISATGTHRLEFNTIAFNVGDATVNSGINCGTVVAPVTFSNNIVFGNVVSMGGKQLGGSVNCKATYSDIGPDTDVVPGAGNIKDDPMFVDTLSNNFRLQAASKAINGADPNAVIRFDIEKRERPQDGRSDMGAYEFKP